jgi:hypothetical protein
VLCTLSDLDQTSALAGALAFAIQALIASDPQYRARSLKSVKSPSRSSPNSETTSNFPTESATVVVLVRPGIKKHQYLCRAGDMIVYLNSR